ncbi:unnamed protein product [Porites lobata]|uniref:PRELI/MSF1 domain-containing protein n=1 Tax=Porites lobata TaxID=104759 RepID=A0ABN8QEH2_9CNID|nr:unnamed protein product [Porites lobata]
MTATVESKAPVVRETSNALHLEGDKFNGTTLEFMLDCDNDSAINPEAASEAEIIQEVVNELIDNVTATVEAKAPVVRETLNALHLEGDKLNGTAHECMLEWDNVRAIDYPKAASEAEIIQDVVNELIDNVSATVEAKAPIVRETLNALHLEGDRLNGTTHECMLELDNESAINYPEAASEAEIIQKEIVNELIDNVTATVEVKAPVVRETLNVLHLEGDKFNATTLEFMLEWDDEGANQPENASDAQIAQGVINSLVDDVVKLETQGVPVVLKSFNENLNDLSVEDDKLNGTAHECTLEWETVGVFEPQTASEAESVNAVTESNYQEEVVSCVAHEFSAAEEKNSAVCKSFPDFAIELESVGGVTAIPLEEEIVNVTAQDLTADVRNSSVSELESVTKGEDIASAAETIQAVLSELIDVIELESDDTVVFESASETLNDIPAEVDKPSSVVHEFTLEWEDVSALEPERAEKFQSVTEVTEIFEKEEIFSDFEHEFSPAEVKSRTVCGLHAPELAFDSQSELSTADIPLELSHFAKITHESVPAKKDSAFFSDGSNQMDNGKDDSTIYDDEVQAAELKTGNISTNESSLELKSVDYAAACSDFKDHFIGNKTLCNGDFEQTGTAEQAGCQHFLNAQAEEFIPSLRALDGFKTNDSSRLELGYALSITDQAQSQHTLNPKAKEFHPSFGASERLQTNGSNSITHQAQSQHTLNPNAKEFRPSFRTSKRLQTNGSNSLADQAKSQHILNPGAREFRPSLEASERFQRNGSNSIAFQAQSQHTLNPDAQEFRPSFGTSERFQTNGSFRFNWDQVTSAFWPRYPNPFSRHVLSEDVIERSLVGNKLVTKKLVTKTNSPPRWAERFTSARVACIVEESVVDPEAKTLTTYTKNVTFTRLMVVEEKCVYSVHPTNKEWVTCQKQSWVSSSVFGFSRAIERFGIERYKLNTSKASKGLQSILEKLYVPERPHIPLALPVPQIS